jgi:hypothetical protein
MILQAMNAHICSKTLSCWIIFCLLVSFICEGHVGAQDEMWFPESLPARSRDRYSALLRRVDEARLYGKITNAPQDSFRLIWVRTFDNPIIVRVSNQGSQIQGRMVRLNGNGYNAGEIMKQETFSLTAKEWSRITNSIGKAPFWALAAFDTKHKGNDGARWVLEVSTQGRYHVVERWSPSQSTELSGFMGACTEILQAAGIDLDREVVY